LKFDGDPKIMFTKLLSFMPFTAELEFMFEMRESTKDSIPNVLPTSATNV